MIVRRRVKDRPSVVEAEAVRDGRLSARALGILCYLSGAPAAGYEVPDLLARFPMPAGDLDAALGELCAAGYLADRADPDASARGAMVPPPRRRPPRRRPIRPPSSTLLYLMLERLADPRGCACPSNREISAALGQEGRTIQRNLLILEAEGLVRRRTRDCGEDGFQREIWVLGRGRSAGSALQ